MPETTQTQTQPTTTSVKEHVTLDATSGRHKGDDFAIVDGVTFYVGRPVKVADKALRDELTSGESDRLKGLSFSLSDGK